MRRTKQGHAVRVTGSSTLLIRNSEKLPEQLEQFGALPENTGRPEDSLAFSSPKGLYQKLVAPRAVGGKKIPFLPKQRGEALFQKELRRYPVKTSTMSCVMVSS